MGDRLDGFAVGASAVCMAHCLLLPLLLAALPTLAAWIDPGETFHRVVLAIAVPTSTLALTGGWRAHRSLVPVVMGMAGLTLMTLGIVLAARSSTETILTVAGSVLLAVGHLVNWRGRFGGKAGKGDAVK
ncbi:MerC domain-containing protein [Sphingomonas faeni]|uniref:MerC domain-containing protein n=1 Tax=Sphingomonas faeni TaxID=185950 RepID=UPI0033591D19